GEPAEQARAALETADGLLVSDRLRADMLALAAPAILDVLDRGRPAVILGENRVGEWLPGFAEHPRPTIFWWWRTGEPHRMTRPNPEHPAQGIFTDRSVIWHSHGVLALPEGATTLVDLAREDGERDGSILAVWERPGHAPVLVSTMDPVYHHGSGFMPGATQLLYRSLTWLRDTIRAAAQPDPDTQPRPAPTHNR
ncbi:hypothetical protein, partial [Leucobacter sp. M11]|uniref:hypothetical protein n=1 Tax=Leucobacter sp. M11 TaxID=2993565 RepID=UPI002D804D05